ncbi:MAG: hypothetical protein ACFFCM_15635, partial [Promethearchaeota archaeon]
MPRKSIGKGPNLGIKYENHINQILKERGYQLKKTISAGASDAPDGYFWYKGNRYPFEIKRPNADFAQVELRWDVESGFYYSEMSKNPYFINFLTENTKFLEKINETWTESPKKFTCKNLTQSDRNWDLDHFSDIKESIKVSYIEKFYNLKNPSIFYIQIQNRGFYYLGQ